MDYHPRVTRRTHRYSCINCDNKRHGLRLPKGWWILVDGSLACSEGCARQGHANWQREQENLAALVALAAEEKGRGEGEQA